MFNIIRDWKKQFKLKKQYCTGSRLPFFDLAANFLPSDGSGMVVDIGAGNGKFADHLNLAKKYRNFYLLDGNEETVENLKTIFKNVIQYQVPNQLPFENLSVNYIHCSHLIEHLIPDHLYKFIQEIDRVLCHGGILVISTPMLWPRFYDDLSHIKPYNPQVFINYLCSGKEEPSIKIISKNYIIEDLVYRYRVAPFDERWNSRYLLADLLLRFFKEAFAKIGFYKSIKNGYTLVLRKNTRFN